MPDCHGRTFPAALSRTPGRHAEIADDDPDGAGADDQDGRGNLIQKAPVMGQNVVVELERWATNGQRQHEHHGSSDNQFQ